MLYRLFIAAIILSANINAQVIIKNIIVMDNWKTDESIIKKNCAFIEGEELTKNQIENDIEITKQNLNNTLYFDNVTVTPLYDSLETHADIVVQINESSFPYRISGGNMFVGLDFLNTAGNYDEKDFALGANVIKYTQSRKWLNGTNLGYKFQAGWNKYSEVELQTAIDEVASFSKWYANAQIDYFFTPRLSAFGQAGYEYSIPYGIKNNSIIDDFNLNKYHNLFFTAGVTLDNRNSVLYPSAGQYLKLDAERGTDLNGSNNIYEKYSFDMRQYYPISPGISLFARIYGGIVLNNPPYTKLLWNNNIHGIRIKGMDLYNGYKTVLFTGELRSNILKTNFLFGTWIESLFFIDAGNVWFKSENINLGKLNVGYGPGIRIHIPRPVYVDINLIYSIGKMNGLFFGVEQNL